MAQVSDPQHGLESDDDAPWHSLLRLANPETNREMSLFNNHIEFNSEQRRKAFREMQRLAQKEFDDKERLERESFEEHQYLEMEDFEDFEENLENYLDDSWNRSIYVCEHLCGCPASILTQLSTKESRKPADLLFPHILLHDFQNYLPRYNNGFGA